MPTTFFLNEDITAEILALLPAKDICRLRCVCKQWLHLLSNPRFIQHHSARNPHPPVSGFFLSDHNHGSQHFPIKPNPPRLPNPTLSFIPADDGTRIFVESSCNGLIICFQKAMYYVCNPTTREFVELPVPDEVARNLSLVFDPSKSPHYKVISICSQVHIYSSETRSWKLSMDNTKLRESVSAHQAGSIHWKRSTYWNSTLVWLVTRYLLSFDVTRECITKLTLPPEAPHYSKVIYMGESRGKLVVIGKPRNQEPYVFYILETDNLCSGWSLIYKVDLYRIGDLYPEIRKRPIWVSGIKRNVRRRAVNCAGFLPVHLSMGGEGEGQLLFLNVPGKIISYNLSDKSFTKVRDLLSSMGPYDCLYGWRKFEFLGHTLFSP
ncbi:uncharacterized protein A4U43_C10F17710 [Asparagus officinalis]|uniref:F-box domain-containing protein n=1 Tax=Asparagus officinalis TaxID=4686 RepID=A0A5P1E3U9_ASPOF|nr:F-box protein At5g07610-like [Asparagus officinalis]ONK57208.1 uncharacterized protein A4U43_C10F17710 [Asparagus officinalis]